MVQTGLLTEVHERIQRARDSASALSARSEQLIREAQLLRQQNVRTRRVPVVVSDLPAPPDAPREPVGVTRVPLADPTAAASLATLDDPRLQLRTFRLEGRIGNERVSARYQAGALVCDDLLRTHGELVVAMGDTFPFGDPAHGLPASLEGPPVVVLLTLMRAAYVTKVDAAV